jgi:hypothetical protein
LLHSADSGTVDPVAMPRFSARVFLATLAVGVVAHAEDAQNCISDYEDAQTLRREAHYERALAKFGACAAPACPSAVSLECVAWASKLDATMPRIVVRAQDEHERPIAGVLVKVDDLERGRLPAAAEMKLDPGEHVIRAEAWGYSPVEAHVVVEDDPRPRPLVLLLRNELVAQAPRTTTSDSGSSPSISTDKAPHANSTRVLAYVFGGLGVVAMGGFAYFGLAGTHEKHELDACKPYCDPSRVDSARLKLTLADVSLGVGIASLGAAVWLYVASRDGGSRQARVGVMALPGGVAAAAAARF